MKEMKNIEFEKDLSIGLNDEEEEEDEDEDEEIEEKSNNILIDYEHCKDINNEKTKCSESKDNEKEQLFKKDNKEKNEKNNLVEILKRLEDNLKEEKYDSIPNAYEDLLNNEDITKRKLLEGTNHCLMKFMFYFVAPIFGIVFLIGIFQIISVKKSLENLLIESSKQYYKCTFYDKCNITLNNNTYYIYDFYDYYYNSTMDETIDFKLMMITGFIGELLLKSRGFRISSGLLSIPIFGSLIWLCAFNFNFEEEYVFDYGFLKLLNLAFIYILILIGIGGSALLSQQILIDSLLKYKDFIIREERKKIKMKEKVIEKDGEINQNLVKSFTKTSTIKMRGLDENTRLLKKEQNLTKKEKNKFDFFFIISITTIIAYICKYLINIFLQYFLKKIFGFKFTKSKIYFFYSIIILYFFSLITSLLLYSIFVLIFTENNKDEEKGNSYRICQICGFIIYSEKRILKKEKKVGCIRLCLESIKNCWVKTFFRGNEASSQICCRCIDYNESDYDKNKEFFCYCYQTNRKSYWCNKFITNETQQKIFPFMFEYFTLQLTTIAFEEIYVESKENKEQIITFIIVFGGSFILFFYFTISLSRFFKGCYGDKSKEMIKETMNTLDNNNEDSLKELKEYKDFFHTLFDQITSGNNTNPLFNQDSQQKETISKLSNEILYGTHGIALFNGVFSLIFSCFYFYQKKDFTRYVYKENNNIIFIPILMNKFYYFTLNYYCSYTSEDNKKFEFISSSTLVSIYMLLWDILLSFLKLIISKYEKKNYIQVLIIIQIVVSSPYALAIGIILIFMLLYLCCSCTCHKFFLCLLSFFLCGGGLWVKMDIMCNYSFDCCEMCENGCCCCELNDTYLYCNCCCCDEKSSCYSEKCDNSNGFDLCLDCPGCNIFNFCYYCCCCCLCDSTNDV